MKRVPLLLAVAVLFFSRSGSLAAQTPELPLMPLPAHATLGEGQLLIDGNFRADLQGYSDARLVSARARFLATLFRETGIPLLPESHQRAANFVIKTTAASAPVQKLGEDESYRLVVTPTGATLTAPNPLGVLRGFQTFLQLVRPAPQGFSVPAVTIDDRPRFPWRGLMIDSGRHFIPLPVILRNLDGMEAVKLNVLHWHISDDQGFRAESKVYPLLQGKGSDGNYYSQQQIREVIHYAADRGIRVVPEFDMPCHTASWFPGYPNLASDKGPHQIADTWGVQDAAMDPTRESTYQFLDRFIAEMAALFPDAYFHIGGDECNGREWNANPEIQAYRKAHNIKDNAALQSYFTARVQKIVTAHHKIMEGWDEVLHSDTPRDVVIHSWRGEKALAVAARQGNRVVLSNGYYIDLNQSASHHYLVDPLAGDATTLTPEEAARVLGGEATEWTEFISEEKIDSGIWPRTAAIAERYWSPQEVRDVDSMYRRLAIVSQRLDYYGLQHNAGRRLMLERIAGDPGILHPLEVLASAVQPIQGYGRARWHEYHTYTPLNHLVDAIPAESETARNFKHLAEQIAAGKASPKDIDQARRCLELWRDNDATLKSSLSQSDILAELVPLSRSLSETASIGLAALDAIENHGALDGDTVKKDTEALAAAAKPEAVLLDMVVPPVQLLVQAAAAQTQSLR